MECGGCGARHGNRPGILDKWHECPNCRVTWCRRCGRELEPAGWGVRSGQVFPNCQATKRLID